MQGFWNKPPYGYVKLEKYEYLETMHQADISFSFSKQYRYQDKYHPIHTSSKFNNSRVKLFVAQGCCILQSDWPESADYIFYNSSSDSSYD